jgi:phosphatidylserine/phosphatidylglycerophosphate/cardiolipin synthase-like enzyme
VRIIARASAKDGGIPVRRLPSRLHLRCIIRDGKSAFVGSQSLRKLELEARREIGVIFEDKDVVEKMTSVFEKDWKKSEPTVTTDTATSAFSVPAKKVAREVLKRMDFQPTLEKVMESVIDPKKDASFEPAEGALSRRHCMR